MSLLTSSDCQAALFHPEDLVPETYPGMRLTAAEARQVEEILTAYLPKQLAFIQDIINEWMPVLHPIPVDEKERRDWDLAPGSLSDKRYIVETERAAYRAITNAFSKGDWTTLLYTFSRPAWSTQHATDLTGALQPFRDELDNRRKELRLAAARRLGCTCLDDPQAAAEAKAVKEREQAKHRGGEEAVAALRAKKLAAEKAAAIDTRRWEMPKETADELATAVTKLYYDLKLTRHVVLGELVAVGLEHLPEVTQRLRRVQAEREAQHARSMGE